jgi:hypothetical protein
MDHLELRERFATLTTAHLADACIRAQIPVRCAPALLRAVIRGSRLGKYSAPCGALPVSRVGLGGGCGYVCCDCGCCGS